MDEAWKLERQFWDDACAGDAGAYYARHLTADGYVVVPGGVLERSALINWWGRREPLTRYALSEPRLLLVDGANVLVNYQATAEGPGLPEHLWWVTSLYTWEGGGWSLVFRQYTPRQPDGG